MGVRAHVGTMESGHGLPKETPSRSESKKPPQQNETVGVKNTSIVFVPPYELKTMPPENDIGNDELTIAFSDLIIAPTIAQALQIRFEAAEMPPTEKPSISPKLLAELAGKVAARG